MKQFDKEEYLIPLSDILKVKNVTLPVFIKQTSFPLVDNLGHLLVPYYHDNDLVFNSVRADLTEFDGWYWTDSDAASELSANLKYKNEDVFVDFRIFNKYAPKSDGDRFDSKDVRCRSPNIKVIRISTPNHGDGCYHYVDLENKYTKKTDDPYYSMDGEILNNDGERSAMLPCEEDNYDYNFHPLDLFTEISPEFEIIQTQIRNYASGISPHLQTTGNKMSTQLVQGMSAATLKSSLATNVLDPNKAALISATKLEVGSIALDLITTQVIKSLPPIFGMMANDNPAVKVVIANLINLVITNTEIEDPRVLVVNEAMMTVAWHETLKTFDFKGMIEDALDKLPTAKLKSLVKAAETPAA